MSSEVQDDVVADIITAMKSDAETFEQRAAVGFKKLGERQAQMMMSLANWGECMLVWGEMNERRPARASLFRINEAVRKAGWTQ